MIYIEGSSLKFIYHSNIIIYSRVSFLAAFTELKENGSKSKTNIEVLLVNLDIKQIERSKMSILMKKFKLECEIAQSLLFINNEQITFLKSLYISVTFREINLYYHICLMK